MKSTTRFSFLALVTIFVLLFSLVNPGIALADDETPPVAPTEEVSQPPTEDASEEPAQPPVEDVTEDPAQPPVGDLTEDPAPVQEDATVAEILAQLPEDTQLVVVNEEGETLALVSEEAAQIFEEGDPQWCMNGYTPADDPTGSNGYCTAPFARFLYVNAGNPGLIQTLINDGGALYSGPGTIFVSENNIAAFDQNKNIILDGSLLSALSNSGLTIQGGWDFTTQTQSLNQSVFRNSTLQVLNWDGNVTVNDIRFNLTGVSGDGLNATSIDGDVIVNNVTVTGSLGDGLHIEDAHNVTVNDGTFNDNNNHGAQIINVDGDITLNTVTASRNENGSGAYLDNTAGTGNIILGGSNTFNANADNGIQATSNGNITSVDINVYLEANRNVEGSGVLLSNVNGTGYVTLAGTNVFNANGTHGIEVESSGNINLNNVEANRNSASGAYLLNSTGSGDIYLTENGVFYQNGSNGVYAYSNGDISLDNIEANQNGSDGAYLDNCNWDVGLSICLGSGDITMAGTANSFNDNDDNGLEAYSAGNIWLTEVEANRNSSHGAYLNNTYGSGSITLTDITANFNEDGNGVYAYAAGDVTINGTFKGNDRRGAYIQSNFGNIEVTLAEFINNGMSGLRAEAYNFNNDGHGNITLDGISSEKNGIHGANLMAGGDINIIGSSEFINNDESGVHIIGLFGNLFVSGSLFSENDKHGLDAEFINGNASVESSVFTWNHRNGLNLLVVDGSIDITGSDFLNNNHDGAHLGNCGCSISDITIASSVFSDNGWNGLEAYSHGLISLNGVTADGNDEVGAYLDNISGTANVDVENSGFNDNDDAGLAILSNGNVTLTNVTASDNDDVGVAIASLGNVALTNVTVSYSDAGVAIENLGNVTLASVTASYNDVGVGIISFGNVTLTDVAALYNNDVGLFTFTTGNVTIDSSEFSDNNDVGALLVVDGNASICGATFTNNDIGLDASNVLGTLTMGNVFFSGNTTDYLYPGSVTDCYPSSVGGGGGGNRSSVIIPVTGGEEITCDATLTSTTVKLSNGAEVTLPCPINDFAVVNPTAESELPDPLEKEDHFVSALTVRVVRDGQSIESLDDTMRVSFLIPAGESAENLSILFWDGTEWQDLGGAVNTDGLYFEISTAQLGTFVLAKR